MARGVRLLLRIAGLLLITAGVGCADREPESPGEVLVTVDRIAVDDHDVPVVVLEETDGPRWLPIWIGTAEARSIALQMEARSLPRPNSHDLARDVIEGLDGHVERVVVTELRDGTYYAILALSLGSRRIDIDARPSDAIAIALRAGAPIFVRAQVFENAGGSSQAGSEERREI